MYLGGEDFDEIIVKDYIENFEDEHKTQFPDDKNIRRKLLNQCREAKESMTGTTANLDIEVITLYLYVVLQACWRIEFNKPAALTN